MKFSKKMKFFKFYLKKSIKENNTELYIPIICTNFYQSIYLFIYLFIHDRVNTDFKNSIDRENILQKSKVDMELEWRKRLESRESDIYHQHEELIRTLKSSKEDVREFFVVALFCRPGFSLFLD